MIEPVPGAAAKPPATGMDEKGEAAVRELVRCLPWNEWADHRGQTSFRLTAVDADSVHAAICAAMTKAEITLEQATEIGQIALGRARSKPVPYVAGAFASPKLELYVRELRVEPLSADPLPLLREPEQQSDGVKRGRRVGGKRADRRLPGTADADAEQASSGNDLWARKCEKSKGGCGAAAEATRMERMVEDADGRLALCKVCSP